MRLLLAVFFTPFKILNTWLFVIPSRLPILTLVCCYLAIDFSIGEQPVYLFNRQLVVGSTFYFTFWVGLAWPMLFALASLFTGSVAASTGHSINSALDQAINFRNSQMRVSTPKKAFELLKDTAALDVLQANSDKDVYKSAVQGFNALHGTDSPTSVFKALTEKGN